MTGDLSQDLSAQAYHALREMMTDAPAPIYCLPGNHDDREMMKEILDSAPFQYRGAPKLGNWLLPMLDTWDGDRAGGLVGTDGLAALDKQLSESTLPYALVCLHHQAVPVNCKWLDSVGLDDAEDLMKLLRSHSSVRGVVWGHVHQEFESSAGDIRLMGSPSTCYQFLPHKDTFDIDDLPAGYRRICLSDDGQIDSQVMWVADDPV
jgi:Icc protein